MCDPEPGSEDPTQPLGEGENPTDASEVFTIQCTESAAVQLRKAIDSGKIPFAKTDVGMLFLGLLLYSFKGRIDSFCITIHGTPVINNFMPGAGGLSSLSWKLWQIAVKFPYKVDSLIQVAGVLIHPGVSYNSLSPQLRNIIDQFENLKSDKGEVVCMVPKERAKLAQLGKDCHNPEAVDKLIKAQYGEGLTLQDVILDTSTQNRGRVDKLIFASNSRFGVCPHCGQVTIRRAPGGPSSEPRMFWDTPIRFGIPTMVEIHGVKKYVCENQECPKNQFTETFSCVLPRKQFSIRLTGMVLAMAALTSYHGEQDLWMLCGVHISDQTIRRLVLDLVFPDDPDIEKIGIDDVAKRKGCSYYTIIYAVDDHRLLAIVDGRDGSELIKWLDEHKNVRLICRDRGSAYSSAIDKWAEEHKVDVTEIADRFHLIQNMIEHLKAHCASSLPLNFGIIEEGGQARIVEGDEVPSKKAFAKAAEPTAEQMAAYDAYDNSPFDKDQNRIEFELPSPNGTSKGTKGTKAAPPSDQVTDEDTGADQRPLDEAEQKKRIESYTRKCYIRNDLNPSKPRKPQYKELACKYGSTSKEISRICRMDYEAVEAILEGVDEAKKTEVKASHQPTLGPKKMDATVTTSATENVTEIDGETDYNKARSIRTEFEPTKARKPQYQALAEKYGVDPKVVKRYCLMSDEEVEALKDMKDTKDTKDTNDTIIVTSKPKKARKRKIDDYKYIIYKMLQDGHNISDIFWYIKHKGCTLTDEGLLKSIISIYEIVFPGHRVPDIKQYIDFRYKEGEYHIRRCELMKYLVTVNPKTKKNEIIDKYIQLILDKYASVRNVQTIFSEFHSAVMGDAEEAIDVFISKYENGQLRGFCKSISRDIEAIKNAIRYTYSSGFVEGGNSKFKTLKRLSGGRLQLNSLIQKCMLGFWYTLDGFQLKDIAPFLDIY